MKTRAVLDGREAAGSFEWERSCGQFMRECKHGQSNLSGERREFVEGRDLRHLSNLSNLTDSTRICLIRLI